LEQSAANASRAAMWVCLIHLPPSSSSAPAAAAAAAAACTACTLFCCVFCSVFSVSIGAYVTVKQ
jgi:hypothetical protein